MADITSGEWIQIALAFLALFGGGFAGAKLGALSRLHVEVRRQALELRDELAFMARLPSMAILPGRELVDFSYSTGLTFEQRAVVAIDQVQFLINKSAERSLETCEQAARELKELVDLLPLWDRQSWRRFDHATAGLQGIVGSLVSANTYVGNTEEWIVQHFPEAPDGRGQTRGFAAGRSESSGWQAEKHLFSFGAPSLAEGDRYTYRVGLGNGSGGTFLLDGDDMNWGAAWDDFSGHLRRQLRPGRWRNVQEKRYRVGLMIAYLRRRRKPRRVRSEVRRRGESVAGL